METEVEMEMEVETGDRTVSKVWRAYPEREGEIQGALLKWVTMPLRWAFHDDVRSGIQTRLSRRAAPYLTREFTHHSTTRTS